MARTAPDGLAGATTAWQAHLPGGTSPEGRGTSGPNCAAHLEWLRPAIEIAAPASRYWPRPAPTWMHRARVATRTPRLDHGSIGAARMFAGEILGRWGVDELGHEVGVVLSELLTNAFRHALPCRADDCGAAPIRLGLLYLWPWVLCAVADPSAEVPVMRAPDFFAEGGRGLHVVASLSDRWGWTAPGHLGKVVWATFPALAC